MAGKTFTLEIVTPKKVVFTGEVVSFSAPGVMGGFQVLYNHAPMLAAVGIGQGKFLDNSGNEVRYATSGGFVNVAQNHVTLLAESAERAEEIDVPRAEAAKARATERLGQRSADIDVERARVALQRAMNRLSVASRE